MSPEVETKVEEYFDHRDRFSRGLVIAIVLTTLLAAVVAALQAGALRHHDEAVDRADQWAVLSTQAGNRWETAARQQIARYRLVEDTRARGERVAAAAYFATGPRQRVLTAHARRWDTMTTELETESVRLAAGARPAFAQMNEASGQTTPDVTTRLPAREGACPRPVWAGRVTPPAIAAGRAGESREQDPYFPERYLADARRVTYFLDARRDGARVEAEVAEKRFTRFAVSLTIFAVAVFLLGFSLSQPGRTHRHLYATVAGTFVLGAVSWAIFAASRDQYHPSAAAALAYADGRVALDRGDAARATAYLTCAIHLQPDFARAYFDRSNATGSDPRDPTGNNATELSALSTQASGLRDAQTAKDMHLEDPTLPVTEGSYLFERGLVDHDRELMQRGLDLELDAAHELSDDPIPALNVAEARVALGEPGATAYREAERRQRRRVRTTYASWNDYVSEALTDLEDVAGHLPRRSRQLAQVAAAKEAVVRAAAVDSSQSRLRGPLRIHSVDVQPGFTVVITDPPAGSRAAALKGESVYAQWYYRPSARRPWAAFYGTLSSEQSMRVDFNERLFAITPYSPSTTCLRSGQYRVELYAAGRLRASMDRTVSIAADRPTFPRDMNLSLCLPPGWAPVRHAPSRGGVVAAYTSGSAGFLAVDATPAGMGGTGGRWGQRVIDRVLRRVRPRLAVPRLTLATVVPGYPFLGGEQTTELREYSYRGGMLYAAVGRTAAGRTIVAIAYGPRRLFDKPANASSTATNMIASVVTGDVGS